MSTKIPTSSGKRQASLRPTETGIVFAYLPYFNIDYQVYIVPIYDGRNKELKIPEDLKNVPGSLPRYIGHIPRHSLALVAYTTSLYRPASGARQNHPTATLNIQFGVVLYEPDNETGDINDEDGTNGEGEDEDGTNGEGKDEDGTNGEGEDEDGTISEGEDEDEAIGEDEDEEHIDEAAMNEDDVAGEPSDDD